MESEVLGRVPVLTTSWVTSHKSVDLTEPRVAYLYIGVSTGMSNSYSSEN